MTITRNTTYTFWCDIGEYCLDSHDNRLSITIRANSKPVATEWARQKGWFVKKNRVKCKWCTSRTQAQRI